MQSAKVEVHQRFTYCGAGELEKGNFPFSLQQHMSSSDYGDIIDSYNDAIAEALHSMGNLTIFRSIFAIIGLIILFTGLTLIQIEGNLLWAGLALILISSPCMLGGFYFFTKKQLELVNQLMKDSEPINQEWSTKYPSLTFRLKKRSTGYRRRRRRIEVSLVIETAPVFIPGMQPVMMGQGAVPVYQQGQQAYPVQPQQAYPVQPGVQLFQPQQGVQMQPQGQYQVAQPVQQGYAQPTEVMGKPVV